MTKLDDDYQANAEECRQMAAKGVRPEDRAAWLTLATGWSMLIRQQKRTAAERFEAIERERGTVQERSLAQH